MTTPQKQGLAAEPITEGVIADYLRHHPDFFEKHVHLLALLNIPHPCGSAVSLIERQVEVLRDQNTQLRNKLNELVQTARDNERLNARMHKIVLSLFGADSVAELLQTLLEGLRKEFKPEFLVLRLLPEPVAGAGVPVEWLIDAEAGVLKTLFKNRKPLCGRLKREQLEQLFGEAAAEVGSSVVVPVHGRAPVGLLALGSHNPKRYYHGMGTAYLSQLGELVGHAVEHRLGTPPQAEPAR